MIPGLSFDQRSYRTIPRRRMIDHMLAHGWLFEDPDLARPDAEAALERLVSLGLPHQSDRFDPVEVMNAIRAAGRAGLDDTWAERLLPNARRLVSPGLMPGPVPDLSSLPDQDYRVTICRTFSVPVSEPVRLRLPLPLDMEAPPILTCSVPGAQTRTGNGWADFRLKAPETGEVSCSAKVTLTGQVQGPDGADLGAQDRELYTRPVEGLVRVTSRVRELADKLAGAQTDPGLQVALFLDFMDRDLRQGGLGHHGLNPEAPGDLVLDGGWYDCVAGSALLVSLCRARGIPSRLVSGYGLYAAASGAHNWLEVWFEGRGWMPFDLTSLELGQGGVARDWRDCFLGCLDHRMVVERLPRLFAGMGSLNLPAAWHLLAAANSEGVVHDLVDAMTGDRIYSESVRVEALGL